MSDFVNEFFRAHYPADADNREPDWCGNGVEQRYRGSASNIFPRMVCADGLTLSVQGHFGAYSYPRGDFEEKYRQVEIMGPPGIPELAEYERGCNACGEEMIYPYVPVETVNQMIANRGGLASDSRSKPDRAETTKIGSVGDESGGAEGNRSKPVAQPTELSRQQP